MNPNINITGIIKFLVGLVIVLLALVIYKSCQPRHVYYSKNFSHYAVMRRLDSSHVKGR